MAKKFAISESVFIKSGMSFEDLAQHFRSANLVIYPSYYEGQGLIPLEALSSGTPVITVDQAPLTEMIDTTVGRLFKTGDSNDLAKQVNALLADKSALESLSTAGRERILAKHTYEHNATKFIQIYESITK